MFFMSVIKLLCVVCISGPQRPPTCTAKKEGGAPSLYLYTGSTARCAHSSLLPNHEYAARLLRHLEEEELVKSPGEPRDLIQDTQTQRPFVRPSRGPPRATLGASWMPALTVRTKSKGALAKAVTVSSTLRCRFQASRYQASSMKVILELLRQMVTAWTCRCAGCKAWTRSAQTGRK